MPETEVYRLKITRDDLAALDEEERCLVLLFGHMANELLTLQRLLVFSLQGSESSDVGERIASGRATIILRLLCGKLFEAHELVVNRVQKNKTGAHYANQMGDEGKACYKRIRLQKGREAGQILSKLRNGHAFHYPNNSDIEAAFSSLSPDEDLEFFLSPNGDASFYQAAEIVFQVASMKATTINDVEQAINRIMDIVVASALDLVTFARLYVETVLGIKSNLMKVLPESEIIPAQYLEDTRIPPITVRRQSNP